MFIFSCCLFNRLCPGNTQPQTVAVRVLAGCWWVFCVVVVASYSSKLISSLTVRFTEPPVKSLQDLVESRKLLWTYLASSAMEEVFKVGWFTSRFVALFFFRIFRRRFLELYKKKNNFVSLFLSLMAKFRRKHSRYSLSLSMFSSMDLIMYFLHHFDSSVIKYNSVSISLLLLLWSTVYQC